MSTKYRISQSGKTSTRERSLENPTTSDQLRHITVSTDSQRRVLRTEGGSSGYPGVPTARVAIQGALVNVLDEYGIATEEDVDAIKTRLETVENQVEEVKDGIDDIPTEDDMESLLESYLD